MRAQLLLWLAILSVGIGLFGAEGRAADRPNVLFIAVDDLNHWVTHLGRNPQAKTPNIDRLAKLGTTFTRAYCAVPACEPSRLSLMGGRRASTSGCYANGCSWKNFQLPGEGLSAQFLKAGYYVAGAGKIYHSDQYHPEEWDEYQDSKKYSRNGGVSKHEGYFSPLEKDLSDEDLLDWHTVNYCIERMNNASDKPFFLACGLFKPHLPFAAPRKYYDEFPLDEIQLPPYREDDLADIPPAGVRMAGPQKDHARFLKQGNWTTPIQSYLATCAYTDMNIGRLLDAWEKSPQRDNTIIVLWGDHGWSFGEKHHWRKFALWEEPTRVPYIWVVPGVTKAGSVCERTVDLMSVYPTLCELAGLPRPHHVEGHSIATLLSDPKASWEHPALTTHGFGNHAVRTEDWRYIQYENGEEELYDHRNDPYEWTNLANDPEHEATKESLKHYLPGLNVPKKVKSKPKAKKAKAQ
ncbi:Arylsulfatase [Calycomorphotria hydatis]|uniref:Arylsulfatase n=2 Tax=Calycomorphotria hydatis TaxID=2528027 RepID=A0A517T788_9PLAN|nr:sulfatase [Calycomorphotria hydatis]QDT64238.1 Arylsulfatase [Calycomorphotria hydatis]